VLAGTAYLDGRILPRRVPARARSPVPDEAVRAFTR
jgi:hypothetical protein